MMLTMLAHVFLWHVKVQMGKKSTGPDGVASQEIISGGLTAQNVDD
jgi:hypothetical protein